MGHHDAVDVSVVTDFHVEYHVALRPGHYTAFSDLQASGLVIKYLDLVVVRKKFLVIALVRF